MRILIETAELSRPIRLRLPTAMLCSSLSGVIIDKAIRKAQKQSSATAEIAADREPDEHCVEISLSDDEIREAATAEPDSALPWREIIHHLHSFSRSHPDFTLCEIRTGDTYVKITL